MLRLLRIAYTYTLILSAVAVASFGILVTSLLRMPRPVVDVFYRGFSRFALPVARARLAHVRWRVPQEELPPQIVIVANHESHLDSMVLWMVFTERSPRWVAKRQLFMFPLFGWAIWASGNVAVSRGDTGGDVAKLSDARARARDRDIVFFPEGTRSRDGRLGQFKKGPFAFALQNRRTIVPVGIGGTREILASHELDPKRGDVAVVVGEPISVEGLSYDDREALRDRCRAAIAELRHEALRLVGSPRSGEELAPAAKR